MGLAGGGDEVEGFVAVGLEVALAASWSAGRRSRLRPLLSRRCSWFADGITPSSAASSRPLAGNSSSPTTFGASVPSMALYGLFTSAGAVIWVDAGAWFGSDRRS